MDAVSIFGKVANFLSGGIGSKVADKVLGLLPDNLTETEKAQIHAAAVQAEAENERELLKLINIEQENFNQRIKDLEGTATDLKSFGIIGKLIVLLRGAQRPTWGFAVLYMDCEVFSGSWVLETARELPAQGLTLTSAFWLINFLVLGFLFGERAVKNILPIVSRLLDKKGL